VQSDLQCATHFGETVLHLLIAEGHNDLASRVFLRDSSLLKARNNISETPLHCAAKVGNMDIILLLVQHAPEDMREALKETNDNGDTALHVAAKHGHVDVCCQLMILDPRAAYKVNKEGLSPFYIAIVEGYTPLVLNMLELDPTLACTRFSDGMYPIHVAARVCNAALVIHFMRDQNLADFAEFLDHRGRNLFHIAAEANNAKVITEVFAEKINKTVCNDMVDEMINAKDYEGNTPLHIAAIKGHVPAMKAISTNLIHDEQQVANNQGLTPFDLSAKQVEKNAIQVCLIILTTFNLFIYLHNKDENLNYSILMSIKDHLLGFQIYKGSFIWEL
jgi:ankyrin repeat protein